MLTTFLICKAADVASLLLAKDKAKVVCNTGTCDNENAEETEKMVDDQLMIESHLSYNKIAVSVILKTVFSYTVVCENEIYRNLVSPPPEFA
ncbi:hypothetical protein [Dyadobacter sp. LHD-138]|uniref:hypothetical protein n=1 Tax=Dyadobacter sp. LHD-138 TaxID=3071413 RepID=UPI0027E109A5|nr:hypothetical protein [Dyadobacter sp. LHD-138]MDQ6479608.1 hypothetical protein [Dyadobacter sp. LHD-138]